MTEAGDRGHMKSGDSYIIVRDIKREDLDSMGTRRVRKVHRDR